MKHADGTIQTGTIGKDQKFVQYFLIVLFQVQLGGTSNYRLAMFSFDFKYGGTIMKEINQNGGVYNVITKGLGFINRAGALPRLRSELARRSRQRRRLLESRENVHELRVQYFRIVSIT